MRNTVKANDSKMSRREVEILSLEWSCSFCENNVCSAVQCCRLEFDDGWRAGWAKSLPTLSSIAFSTIHRKESAGKKKNQQEINSNNDKIRGLINSEYSRTPHLN